MKKTLKEKKILLLRLTTLSKNSKKTQEIKVEVENFYFKAFNNIATKKELKLAIYDIKLDLETANSVMNLLEKNEKVINEAFRKLKKYKYQLELHKQKALSIIFSMKYKKDIEFSKEIKRLQNIQRYLYVKDTFIVETTPIN